MSRPLENISRRARFDDCAEVHHEHAVGEMPDSLEIMADEQVTESPLALDTREKLQDAPTSRDVERGSRLVEDHDLRLDGERPSNADALALPAAQLARVAVQVLWRKLDIAEEL